MVVKTGRCHPSLPKTHHNRYALELPFGIQVFHSVCCSTHTRGLTTDADNSFMSLYFCNLTSYRMEGLDALFHFCFLALMSQSGPFSLQ
jgi:hypothetical protein